VRLNRARVLDAAVELADREGIESVNMRNLAEQLGVVPMALYKHVANKDELLDGMVEVLVAEIEAPAGLSDRAGAGSPAEPRGVDRSPTDVPTADGTAAVRARILAARQVVVRHRWARQVLESRTRRTPAVLGYLDALTGLFLDAGFSIDLTHHAMHALGSRMWGFSPELFDDAQTVGPRDVDPVAQRAVLRAAAEQYPHIVEVSLAAIDEAGPRAGQGCDEQFEFEFALDLLLDGFDRLHRAGWTSTPAH
jgi:AcrR family transcriptional regulator